MIARYIYISINMGQIDVADILDDCSDIFVFLVVVENVA